jgi:hypothetical protein
MSKPRKYGYKLFRVRRDGTGTLGPLFINRPQVIQTGSWLQAEPHRTKGFAFRPGWHICSKPLAPHLSKKGRVWFKVEMQNAVPFLRPTAQGGLWFLAQRMKVIKRIHVA